jgi:hypothetical protein
MKMLLRIRNLKLSNKNKNFYQGHKCLMELKDAGERRLSADKSSLRETFIIGSEEMNCVTSTGTGTFEQVQSSKNDNRKRLHNYFIA